MTDLDALSYTAEHEWVSIADGVATFGITDYAAEKLGDVVYVELPAVGSELTGAQICGEIESTKSVGELYAPVAGVVLEVNGDVDADPSLVNADPFGAWLVRVQLGDDTPTGLLDRAAYLELIGGAA
ncbi:MAG: glycine cleavage system protein [Microbacterium sp.]|jgi:glycine cleavage system H protein|nr:glycine cleavage system protein [Microbacterium sp.]